MKETLVSDSAGWPVLTVADDGTLNVDGQRFVSGGIDDVVSTIVGMMKEDETHLVVTANVDQLVNLKSSVSLRDAYGMASVRTIDGMPIIALGRALGAENIERVTGADLLPALVGDTRLQGTTFVLTGGDPENLQAACRLLEERHPDRTFRGVDFPFVEDVSDHSVGSVVAEICGHRPDAVFLCLGSPKQEEFFTTWRDELPSAVYLGVGAAIDFVTGSKKRAPQMVQAMGLEWAFRLVSEPGRLWRRYLVRGPQFIRVVWISVAASLHRHRSAGGPR